MDLNSARKLLSVILSVIIALCTAGFLFSVATVKTLASESFFFKYCVSGEVVKACEEQLEAKYAVLEQQSGIPKEVFLTVKKMHPVGDSLKSSFSGSLGSESSELYSDSLVDYFERLCTDYLDGNSISYNKSDVKETAKEAAKIFSDTVGLHNLGSIGAALAGIKRTATEYMFVSVILLLFTAATVFLVYSNRKKAFLHCYGAACGGAGGAALGAALCRLVSPAAKLIFVPEVYRYVVTAFFNKSFTLMAAGFALIAAAAWFMMLITYKRRRKGD